MKGVEYLGDVLALVGEEGDGHLPPPDAVEKHGRGGEEREGRGVDDRVEVAGVEAQLHLLLFLLGVAHARREAAAQHARDVHQVVVPAERLAALPSPRRTAHLQPAQVGLVEVHS